MNTKRDKFLKEAMDKCWREPNSWPAQHSYFLYKECSKCGALYPCQFDDFSTWNGFGKLWTWVIERDWWDNFKYQKYCGAYCDIDVHIDETDIDPDRFANAVYEFLKERED